MSCELARTSLEQNTPTRILWQDMIENQMPHPSTSFLVVVVAKKAREITVLHDDLLRNIDIRHTSLSHTKTPPPQKNSLQSWGVTIPNLPSLKVKQLLKGEEALSEDRMVTPHVVLAPFRTGSAYIHVCAHPCNTVCGSCLIRARSREAPCCHLLPLSLEDFERRGHRNMAMWNNMALEGILISTSALQPVKWAWGNPVVRDKWAVSWVWLLDTLPRYRTGRK